MFEVNQFNLCLYFTFGTREKVWQKSCSLFFISFSYLNQVPRFRGYPQQVCNEVMNESFQRTRTKQPPVHFTHFTVIHHTQTNKTHHICFIFFSTRMRHPRSNVKKQLISASLSAGFACLQFHLRGRVFFSGFRRSSRVSLITQNKKHVLVCRGDNFHGCVPVTAAACAA